MTREPPKFELSDEDFLKMLDDMGVEVIDDPEIVEK